MQVDAFRALIAVQREGSITTGAKSLGKSASQVGVWLSMLEADLGLPLLNRDGYKAELTPEGETIARHAQDTLFQLSEIERNITEIRATKSKRLKIAMLDVLPIMPFKEALWQLSKLSSDLSLDIEYTPTLKTLEGIEKGEIDFGVVFFHAGVYPRISSRLIGYTEIVTVVSSTHPLASGQAKFNTDDIASHLQLLPQSYLGFGIDQVSKYSENYWLMDSIEMTLALLQKGIGWAELPYYCVEPYIKSGQLVQLRASGESPLWWPLQLVWQKHRPMDRHAAWLIEKFSSPKPGLAISGIALP
ncbi:LysR family transcriptional regulator [Vibrio hangzhouensis]|uniref:LysR family transcriptional regulator n=1 Tax=Vibrio hangzhouensis TaxID=462991 RepID=UPI001C96A4C6|nr:LysR family transcriptional regulator [Vibrio hangzhouensis]MBY6195934.1 LysR family transcriptional regulator [Vibrio hangzhouensis]